MAIVRSLDMILARNTGSYASPVWDVIPNVADLTLTTSAEEGDASSRLSGWRMREPTLRDGTLEFTMPNDPADADLIVLQAAADAGTLLGIAVATGPIATIGTVYRRFQMKVFEDSDDQALADVGKIRFVLKPAYSTDPQGVRTTVAA